MQGACNLAVQNASTLANLVHTQQLHFMHRTAPFAALNLQFARASEAGGKAKRKKKGGDKAPQDGGSASASATTSKAKDKQHEASQAKAQADDAAKEQRANEEERLQEEKQQVSERRRRDAEAKRKAAQERKQEAKRQREQAEKKEQERQQKLKEQALKQQKKEADREHRALQKSLFREAKAILKRQMGESDFVRSLDAVEFEEGDIDEYRTLTGLIPVAVDNLSEGHDELLRDLVPDSEDESLEDVTFAEILMKAEREKKRNEMSADEPGIRDKLREDIYDEMSGAELRPHAPKMQLKPDEHDDLELDQFGKGFFIHPKKLLGLVPWGVVHDLSWGLFGSIPVVQERLGPKWGGQDPVVVLQRQSFYDDILNIAPEMEMTVMMVAERDIPLAELRNKLLDTQHIRLRQVMYREEQLKPLSRKHLVLLAKLKLSLMEDVFEDSGLMDARGNIKKNSKLVLVVNEDGALTAEGITPGAVCDQKVVRLGRWTDTTFARSVMDNFLGLYPMDMEGKGRVGNGVLYAANGFDFRAPERSGNPYQLYDSLPSKEVPDYLSRPSPQEGFVLSPAMFTADRSHPFILKDLEEAAKKPTAPALQPAK